MPARNRLTLFTIAVAFAGGFPVIAHAQGQKIDSTKPGEKPADFDAMIDGLANRNPTPQIVRIGNARRPLFPHDYDWPESDRVAKLRGQLFTNDDPRLWEHLLKRLDDRRYALTVGGDFVTYNYSVGDLCRQAAFARLDFARVHMKIEPGEPFDRVWLDLGYTSLPSWRKQRSQKSLYELQIEVCETAIEKIRTEKDVPAEGKARIERQLRKHIEVLTETKKPLFFRPESIGQYDLFNAKKADEIRIQFEQQNKKKEREKKDK